MPTPNHASCRMATLPPGPAHVQRGQRGGAQDDEADGGAQQGPVDVLQQAAIDADHQIYPPSSTLATFSMKMALRIFRAIGAATCPPLPPRSTRTTTTTSGSPTGANDANQA